MSVLSRVGSRMNSWFVPSDLFLSLYESKLYDPFMTLLLLTLKGLPLQIDIDTPTPVHGKRRVFIVPQRTKIKIVWQKYVVGGFYNYRG